MSLVSTKAILITMGWGKFRVAGVSYDLSHLNTALVSVTPTPAGSATRVVKVSYGCHTFTRDIAPADKPDLWFVNGGEKRCFCVNRHALSSGLPGVVAAAANGARTYFSQGKNFLLVDNGYGAQGPYTVCYTIRKSNKADCDVVMFVVSAYLKPSLPKQLSALTFPTLVATVANGVPVTKPSTRVAW